MVSFNKTTKMGEFVDELVASLAANKNVAKAITQNYCAGKCDTSISSSGMKLVSKEVCVEDADGMAITGHKTVREYLRYAGDIGDEERADRAMEKAYGMSNSAK